MSGVDLDEVAHDPPDTTGGVYVYCGADCGVVCGAVGEVPSGATVLAEPDAVVEPEAVDAAEVWPRPAKARPARIAKPPDRSNPALRANDVNREMRASPSSRALTRS